MATKTTKQRGTGTGVDYIPGLRVSEVPSHGRKHRFEGTKVPRQHTFLSDLELNYFLVLEYMDSVVDVREQFPLEIEITKRIAREKNIKHPTKSKINKPCIMTTDFLIDIRKGNGTKVIARSVKPSEELLSPRVIEKLEVERAYWEELNVDWGIVTEKELHEVVIDNLATIFPHFSLELTSELDLIYSRLEGFSRTEDISLEGACHKVSQELNLPFGDLKRAYLHFLARKRISFDLHSPLSFSSKLNPKKFL